MAVVWRHRNKLIFLAAVVGGEPDIANPTVVVTRLSVRV